MLSYEELDGKVRQTRLKFRPRPDRLCASEVCFEVNLQPKKVGIFFMTVHCICESSNYHSVSYLSSRAEARKDLKDMRGHICEIHTSREQFNEWLNRSQADLCMMLTHKPQGLYPYAGGPEGMELFQPVQLDF